jgi:hypothetical protein
MRFFATIIRMSIVLVPLFSPISLNADDGKRGGKSDVSINGRRVDLLSSEREAFIELQRIRCPTLAAVAHVEGLGQNALLTMNYNGARNSYREWLHALAEQIALPVDAQVGTRTRTFELDRSASASLRALVRILYESESRRHIARLEISKAFDAGESLLKQVRRDTEEGRARIAEALNLEADHWTSRAAVPAESNEQCAKREIAIRACVDSTDPASCRVH